MTKILFLDCDGVLNCNKDFNFTGEMDPLNPGCCMLLREVLAATGAHVVISSVWRMDDGNFGAGTTSVSGWRKLLHRGVLTWNDLGQHLEFPFDFKTPRLSSGVRGEEIQSWLDTWSKAVNLTRFAIVDDDSDMLPNQKPFFVQTSTATGMTQAHADKLIEILNKE